MSETTIPEVLRAAAGYLEVHGWNNHGDSKRDGPCCVIQVFGRVECDERTRFKAKEALRRFLFGHQYLALDTWNDAQPDAATVIAALRSAASAAEGDA